MPAVDYRNMAGDILQYVGGESNIVDATNCSTRLRLKLRDDSLADKAAIEKLPGVMTVVQAGGQFQIVIGDNVSMVLDALSNRMNLTDAAPEKKGSKDNIFNRFIDLISAIFSPVIWLIAAAGLLKAFMSLFVQLGWMDGAGQTYLILNAAGDSTFYFLPVLLGLTSARKFGANQFTAMAIGGALVYPSIVAFVGTGEPVFFAGIPVVMMNYTSSVIPIILAVWVQSHLERLLNRILPATIRNFTTPLVVLVVMVPLVLITIGPVATWAANAIASAIGAAFGTVPWLAGAVVGGFWQVFVIFGLHWGLIPVMLNDLATVGHSVLWGAVLPPVVAQAAATLAVALRTRSAKRRQVAAPAAVSGLLAGITEPALYGVNLPLKRPFYFGIAGGAVGGAIAAIGGAANSEFVVPSLLGLPAYMQHGFVMLLIGIAAAVAIAFILTWFFASREQADEELTAADEQSAALAGSVVKVDTPVAGTMVSLDKVNDKVFSTGAMGEGVGILPTDDNIYAPADGTIVVSMDSGHAYGIKTGEGVELLVHIGINTVELNGKHFTPNVQRGDQVRRGDLLAVADMRALDADGYDTTTVLLVTNSAKLGGVEIVGAETVERGHTAVAVTV